MRPYLSVIRTDRCFHRRIPRLCHFLFSPPLIGRSFDWIVSYMQVCCCEESTGRKGAAFPTPIQTNHYFLILLLEKHPFKQTIMPFVQVTWLPKQCRNAEVRKKVADAIIKAMVGVKEADISPQNLVIRFAESVDGFPLPKGHSENPELRAEQKTGAEAFLAEKK